MTFEKAAALHQQGRLVEAERAYDEILQQRPDHFDALHLRGLIALQSGRLQQGVELIARAIRLKPDVAAAHNNLGTGLTALKRPEEALASYETAIALEPAFALAHNNRGSGLLELDRPADALASFERAIALEPGSAVAHNNRGLALERLKRLNEAVASFEQAIALSSDFAEAHGNRGNALNDLGRHREALASFDKALALNANSAETHNNRGTALNHLHRSAQALESFDRAIAFTPGYAEAHYNRGTALTRLHRNAEAYSAFDKAFALKPDIPGVEGERLHAKMHLCDWRNFDAECARLIASVRNGHASTAPFPFLIIPSTAADQLQCARTWIANKYPASGTPLWRGERYAHDRIRIGYFSADFHAHATTYLMAELFERHDRSRFELTAFSFGPDEQDDMRRRLVAAFDHFLDVRGQPPEQVAMLARQREIDIAVELKGFTGDSHPGIFACRLAPIQVGYLGYPGTMGADYIDYLIADRTLISESERKYYAEKIVTLPGSYQINDRTRRTAETGATRARLGLPESGFVFCCFNAGYKITPEVFDCWMRLLREVEGSVLWLLEGNSEAIANLRREAQARGVDPGRLVFAPRMPAPDHLARHHAADLFLDTLPCNAHTTASDALWAGLPVLTCRGETFAGRVAASLLNAIGLPEMIAANLRDYERIALDLATQPEKMAALKQKLAANRLTAPLFDSARATGHIEAAYLAMHERHRAGLPPAPMTIAS